MILRHSSPKLLSRSLIKILLVLVHCRQIGRCRSVPRKKSWRQMKSGVLPLGLLLTVQNKTPFRGLILWRSTVQVPFKFLSNFLFGCKRVCFCFIIFTLILVRCLYLLSAWVVLVQKQFLILKLLSTLLPRSVMMVFTLPVVFRLSMKLLKM